MGAPDFFGRDVIKTLLKDCFVIADRTGSHVKLRYEHPTNDDDIPVVSVLQHDRIRTRTLRNIADQSRAEDFEKWCRWIDWQC